MEVVVSNLQGGGNNNDNGTREYRKGNWTVQETMVLIEAKRMDDERRMRRHAGESSGGERGKPPELRWKWVEDYCWSNGCLRSQNQCNDKWDNLMRDFKKVREHERRVVSDPQQRPSHGGGGGGDGGNNVKSYWKLDRVERKDCNLPTNMLREIYEALIDVVEKRAGGGQRAVVGSRGGGGSASASTSGFIPQLPPPIHPPEPPQVVAALPLPPPPPPATLAQTPAFHFQHHRPPTTTQSFPTMGESSDPETSEQSDSQAKRRRVGEEEGTQERGNKNSTNNSLEVGPAISRSATLIAEAIQSSEEREERRHREMLNLHERRLQIEESKAEINRQGINGLVDAINRLANSILALAANKNQPPPS
ncbi:unnamed protein product [Cuscuta europaea]|uniref:Myb-like domain-containing protein n=1 Tax=Cuscuta europaea TaxID=41803 RepID=A0A9P0ZP22_CUSEU|nr:unnamed protein product [Cuscuta europaea]